MNNRGARLILAVETVKFVLGVVLVVLISILASCLWVYSAMRAVNSGWFVVLPFLFVFLLSMASLLYQMSRVFKDKARRIKELIHETKEVD